MTLELTITSDKKGSNPGGKCDIKCKHQTKQFYFKYCIGNRLPHRSTLTSTHQPFYEAITCQMASKLGLRVPNHYVLINKGISFFGESENLRKIDPNRPFYFLSEIIATPFEEDLAETVIAMKKEESYRDILSVSDIVGKKQNYFFFKRNSDGYLVYLDLGCNFVQAVNGFIFLQNNVKKEIYRRDFKKSRKNLESYVIMPNDSEANDFVPLSFLTELNPDLIVPCIDSYTCKYHPLPIKDFLNEGEINEISDILICGILENFKRLKDSGVLISN